MKWLRGGWPRVESLACVNCQGHPTKSPSPDSGDVEAATLVDTICVCSSELEVATPSNDPLKVSKGSHCIPDTGQRHPPILHLGDEGQGLTSSA